jgi:hypothetical protein
MRERYLLENDLNERCGNGSWAAPRPSLAAYVTLTGTKDGAIAKTAPPPPEGFMWTILIFRREEALGPCGVSSRRCDVGLASPL